MSDPPAQRRLGGKAIGVAVIVILLIVFVLQNAQQVSVHFLVTSGHPRLIWVIVFCTLLGTAVGYLLGRPASPRSKRQRPPDGEGPFTP